MLLSINWILTAFLLAAVSYLVQDLPWMRKRKRLPPGPKRLPILGNIHMLGKNSHQDLYHLAKKHGPIMYMQLGFVPAIVVSSPEAAEMFLKTHDLVFSGRPYNEASWYIAYGQRNLLFAQYGPYWRNMRKLCTLELFNNHKINSFQSMRKQELELLTESLKQAASNLVAVDLSASISSLSSNTSCLMVFGKKYMDKDFDDRGFKGVIHEVLRLAAVPNLGEFFPFLGLIDPQGLRRRFKALSKVLDEFVEKIIDEHVQSEHHKQTNDFVDTMMTILQSGEAEFEFDRRHVKAILVDMLIGAMDTSSTSIEWTLSELLRKPHIMKKLQKEIEEKVGMDRIVEESDLDNLEYLDMVVKESLRLHPPAPFLLHAGLEDCIVDGYHIKKQSRIIINVWAIGRDPKAWPDPESFIPERFAGSNIDVRGHDFQLLPFSSGRRGCPGLQLGLTVVRLVVAQLVHCFDWELPNKMLPSDLDMTEAFALVTSRANHLMAVPSYRLNK